MTPTAKKQAFLDLPEQARNHIRNGSQTIMVSTSWARAVAEAYIELHEAANDIVTLAKIGEDHAPYWGRLEEALDRSK